MLYDQKVEKIKESRHRRDYLVQLLKSIKCFEEMNVRIKRGENEVRNTLTRFSVNYAKIATQ